MTGATGNLYCGLHEFSDMGFLLHFLRPEDLFVDIGANVGSYSVLAAAHTGANTIAFEPVPNTFSLLTRNIDVNHIQNRVQSLNMALGAEPGVIEFTAGLDTANHVAVHGESGTIKVEVSKLDLYTNSDKTMLLKIDVEGFETEVLRGATQTLSNKNLKAIIIELNGSGDRYGYNEDEIRLMLSQAGFECFAYDPFTRSLTQASGGGEHNSIYIRDAEFVNQRVKSADRVEILDANF